MGHKLVAFHVAFFLASSGLARAATNNFNGPDGAGMARPLPQTQTPAFRAIASNLALGRIGGFENIPAGLLAQGLRAPLARFTSLLGQTQAQAASQEAAQAPFQDLVGPSGSAEAVSDDFVMGHMLALGPTSPGDIARLATYLRERADGDLEIEHTAEGLASAARALQDEGLRRTLVEHLAPWNQAATQVLATGDPSAFNRLIENSLARSGAAQAVLGRGSPASAHMALLQKAPEPFVEHMAEAALSLARHIHEEGFEAIVLSDGAADELARPLLQAAWRRLYGEEAMPPLYVFGPEENRKLYKPGGNWSPEESRGLLDNKLPAGGETKPLGSMKGSKVVFMDNFVSTGHKYGRFKELFPAAGFHRIGFAFLTADEEQAPLQGQEFIARPKDAEFLSQLWRLSRAMSLMDPKRRSPSQANLYNWDEMKATLGRILEAIGAAPLPADAEPKTPAIPEATLVRIRERLLGELSYEDAHREYGEDALRQALSGITLKQANRLLYASVFGQPWEKARTDSVLEQIATRLGLPLEDAQSMLGNFKRGDDLPPPDSSKGWSQRQKKIDAREDVTVAELPARLQEAGYKIHARAPAQTFGRQSPYGPYTEVVVVHHALHYFTGIQIPRGIPTRELGHGSHYTKGGLTYEQSVLWVRNYFPLLRFAPLLLDGKIVYQPQLIEFIYPGSKDGLPVNAEFTPPAAPSGYPGAEVRKLNVIIRGGNSLWTSGTVEEPGFFVTSERTVSENARSNEQILEQAKAYLQAEANFYKRPPAMSPHDWMRNLHAWLGVGYGNIQRSRDQVIDSLAQAARVPREHVIITPWMPGSATGDMDEYAVPLTGNAVAVAQIMPESIESLGFPHEQEYARMLNRWLNERADEFGARGLRVERIPMFAPVNLKPNEFGGWNPDLMTTVNWARLNNHVIVPDFSQYLILLGQPPELVRKLQEQIETRTQKTLALYGMSAEFVDATNLATINGGLHSGPNGSLGCVSAIEYRVSRAASKQQ